MNEMQAILTSRSLAIALVAAILGQGASGQSAPGKTVPGAETPRLPARATPAEYRSHTQAGAVTIAAEFVGHSVPTPMATFTTEDYVVVEVALFGPPEARLKLSPGGFSLRINEKKTPLTAQSYLLVYKSLKDPEYVAPEEIEAKKSKTSSDPEGGSGASDRTPPRIHIPFPVQHLMEQRVQKASLPEGERSLPEAGLLFFQYHGRDSGIYALELVYGGPAGKATLPLQP